MTISDHRIEKLNQLLDDIRSFRERCKKDRKPTFELTGNPDRDRWIKLREKLYLESRNRSR